MNRTLSQLTKDIHEMPFELQFNKSKESAPIGYKFVCNHNMLTDNLYMPNLNWYKEHGYVILKQAYDMYGELVNNSVSLYAKINI